MYAKQAASIRHRVRLRGNNLADSRNSALDLQNISDASHPLQRVKLPLPCSRIVCIVPCNSVIPSLQGGDAEMEGLEPSAEDEDEMQYDEDDDEGIEEDLEDEGTLGMDRLQVHTVDLSEAAAPDGEAAQAGLGASPSAAAPSSTRTQSRWPSRYMPSYCAQVSESPLTGNETKLDQSSKTPMISCLAANQVIFRSELDDRDLMQGGSKSPRRPDVCTSRRHGRRTGG